MCYAGKENMSLGGTPTGEGEVGSLGPKPGLSLASDEGPSKTWDWGVTGCRGEKEEDPGGRAIWELFSKCSQLDLKTNNNPLQCAKPFHS